MKMRHGWMRTVAAALCIVMLIGISGVATAVNVVKNEMDIPMEVSFRFSKSIYTITIVVRNGVVTPAGTNGVLTVLAGSDAVFSFTPNTGYRLESASLDGASIWTRSATSGEPITGTDIQYISQDHVLEVIFGPVPTATPTASPTPTASATASATALPTTAPTARTSTGGGGGGGGSGARATATPTPVTSIALADADIPLANVIGSSIGDCIE